MLKSTNIELHCVGTGAASSSGMTPLNITHRFAAPAERVYDAWLDPKQVRWFLFTTATGQIVRCDIDARLGGRFTIVDRRNSGDILHEGTYLDLERPRRIVFTLRVPKFSAAEDRVTIDIKPAAQSCELTLSTQTADEWADDTRRGWAMILDVLGEMLPAAQPTCGAGLAQHATVPLRVSIYLAELAMTLELHRELLDKNDAASQKEDDVYRDLARRCRELAAQLGDTADDMAAQLELPMGAHDERQWSDRHMKAFASFVHEQDALASVLRIAAFRDEQTLAAMQEKQKKSA
jgi:uncharacterized protein YndB with AHSA1/START domain